MTAIDMSTLRQQVTDSHQALVDTLVDFRAQRDNLNARIRELVVEEAEAARAVRALTPKADR